MKLKLNLLLAGLFVLLLTSMAFAGELRVDVEGGKEILKERNLDAEFSKSFDSQRQKGEIVFTDDSTPIKLMNVTLLQNTYLCNDFCTAVMEIHRIDPSSLSSKVVEKVSKFEDSSYFYFDFDKNDGAAPGLKSIQYYLGLPNTELKTAKNGTRWTVVSWDYTPISYPDDIISLTGNYRIKLVGEKVLSPFNHLDWKPTFFGIQVEELANWSSSSTQGRPERNVTLISPANSTNLTAGNLWNFSCSAVNPAAGVVNVSFWNNASGTWRLNQTITYNASNRTEYGHGIPIDTNFGTTAAKLGQKIEIGNTSDVYLYSVNKSSNDGSTQAFILNISNGDTIASCNFVGDVCRFNSTVRLPNGTTYNLIFNSTGAVSRFKYDSGPGTPYPINFSYLRLTATYPNDDIHDIWTLTSLNYSNVAPARPIANFTLPITQNVNNTFVWACQAFDEDQDFGWSKSNFTARLENVKPNLTILSPADTVSSASIDIQINASDNTGLGYCFFNITRGATLEVANTAIPNCSQVSTTVSGDATYVLWVFANDTHNNVNVSNMTFTVSGDGGGSPSPGGGGGGGGDSPAVVVVGGKSIFSMETEPEGSSKYELEIVPGSQRTKSVLLKNLGTSALTIDLSCKGDLCQYFELEEDSVSLPVGLDIPTRVSFTIKAPGNLKDGKYVTNIYGVARGFSNFDGIITVESNVGHLGILSEILNKLGSAKLIGESSSIPYWLILVIGSVTSFVFTYLLLFQFKGFRTGLSTITAIVGGFLTVFFL